MRRLAVVVTILAVTLSACASAPPKQPSSSTQPAGGGGQLPAMASCMREMHQVFWFYGLLDSFNNAADALDKADLSREEKERLLKAYMEAFGEQLQKGPPGIGAWREEIAKQRKQLKEEAKRRAELRERTQRGESIYLEHLFPLFPDEEERRLVHLGVTLPRWIIGAPGEVLEKVSRGACEKDVMAGRKASIAMGRIVDRVVERRAALVDWRAIRVLKETDRADVAGCTFKGMAADDDMEDVLKKASKIYGNAVVVKDTMRGKDFVVEVYRCQEKGGDR